MKVMVAGYVSDMNGILIWNPAAGMGETVLWSGNSREGYASGEGLLTWFMRKKEVSTYKGFMKHGKQEGFGICKFAGGDIYAGQWKAGLRHGNGKYWFGDGRYYSGPWAKDKRLRKKA
jgi:hypothetical protein